MSEAHHLAAERWLSNEVQNKLRSWVLEHDRRPTTAELERMAADLVWSAEPWLQELLPPETMTRALQVYINVMVPAPINEVSLTFEVKTEEDHG